MGVKKKTYSMDPARLEGESFEDYKKRRKIVNKTIKDYLKGKIVWLSKNTKDLMMGKRDTSWGTMTEEKIKIVQNELLKIKEEDEKNRSA